MSHYTIKLDGGKYTVINYLGALEIRRNGEEWPSARNLSHYGVVLAMAERIEELECAIQAALVGTLDNNGGRHANGMQQYLGHPMIGAWFTDLTRVLEQKP